MHASGGLALNIPCHAPPVSAPHVLPSALGSPGAHPWYSAVVDGCSFAHTKLSADVPEPLKPILGRTPHNQQ